MFNEITIIDIPKITQLQPEGWPDLKDTFIYYINSQNCFPVKLEKNNLIIGIGVAIMFNLSAWLAHIIVHKDFRNKGYGYKIAKYLLAYLKEKGKETISLIATDLGYHVYKKLGFKVINEYAFFEQRNFINHQTNKSICPLTSNMYEKVLKLDSDVTNENRTILLEKKLVKGFAYLSDNELLGFYLPTLGEGLIISKEAAAGIELLKFRISKGNTRGVLPVDNISGCQFYFNNGFQENLRVKRMEIGKSINWKPRNVYSRIGGNFG